MQKSFALKIVALCLICSVLTGVAVYAAVPTDLQTISGGNTTSGTEYTIFTDGTNYFAKNALGAIDYSDDDAGTVITAAAAGGGGIFLSEGTYTLTNESVIELPSNTYFYGIPNKSILDVDANPYCKWPIHIDNGGSNVHIKGIYIDGNSETGASALIYGNTVSHITVEDCYLTGFDGHGIFFETSAKNCIIRNNRIITGSRYCIQIRQGINCLVTGNYLMNNRSPEVGNYGGIVIWTYSANNTVTNNVIHGGEYGINFVDGIGGGIADGNSVKNCYFGIRVTQNNTIVTNNLISNVTIGIDCYAVADYFYYLTIAYNHITQAETVGIEIACDNGLLNRFNKIIGNTIFDPSDDSKKGIIVSRSNDTVISENIVSGYDNSGYGIYVTPGVNSDYNIITNNNVRNNTYDITEDGANNVKENNMEN